MLLPEIRITIIYLVIGVGWILFSDSLLAGLFTSTSVLMSAQSLKGIFYIAVTTLLLYLMLGREFRRKRVIQASLDRHERDYHYVFLNNPQPMWVFDTQTLRFLEVNEAAVEQYGYTRAEFLAMTIKDIRLPGDVPRLLTQINISSSIGDQNQHMGEWQHLLKSGEIIDVDVSGHPMLFEERQAMLIVSRNITGQKVAQREAAEKERLQLALTKEIELRELRNRFMSMVSHEFRNPLATIASSADILQTYYDRLTVERRHEHFDKVKRNVKRLTGLLDDILALTKAESIKPEFQPEPIDLRRLCREIIDDASQNARDNYVISAQLPDQPVHYTADEKLMRHAISNLVSNAVKYSPAGSEINVSLYMTETDWRIKVSDQGMGIPEKDMKRLFSPFHRASNVGGVPGTGLGLAITRQAVELHDGQIEVTSMEGNGTTFMIHLPLMPERVVSQ
jgi:PAS domain S-box-containing protein